MSDKQIAGVEFEFTRGFFQHPKQVGYIQIYQFGEKSVVNSYEIHEHSQVCHELTYIVSGSGTIFVNDTAYEVREGQIVFNRMGERHTIRASEDNKLRYFYIGFMLTEDMPEEALAPMFAFYNSSCTERVAIDRYDLVTIFVKLLNEFYMQMDLSERLIRNLTEQLIISAYRSYSELKPYRIMPENSANTVGYTTYAIIRYIEDNLFCIDSLSKMADDLGYSYNYLSHLFRRKIGMTIQEYVSRKKIERSLEMLRSDRMSVTEIAAALNYDCIQSFSKAFKRVMKMSPTAYKVQTAKEDEER